MLQDAIVSLLGAAHTTRRPGLGSRDLANELAASPATIKRHLDALIQRGLVVREGQARATRYRLSSPPAKVDSTVAPPTGYVLSAAGKVLLTALREPLGSREPIGYDCRFVDDYVPNVTSLLPAALATELEAEGRMRGRQPAGTYARHVLAPLLIDLSWSSSRLEGNRYSLLATEALFQRGTASGDLDAVMLLNHKAAIEFMIDAVPEYGLTVAVVRNLHAILMQDLLADPDSLGNIRRKVVNISDSTYVPSQNPLLLEEMLNQVLEKARLVKNPVEAAFFVWVNMAYLQPFEDGNKRTSRLAANMPLMLYNSAPLSFLDVEAEDYSYAMMGVYERSDMTLAIDLFAHVYRRSIRKYAVQLDAMGVPDPTRLRFREALNEAIGRVVRDGQTADEATTSLDLPAPDIPVFTPLLAEELRILDLHNCARYRLALSQVRRWIEAGRLQ